MARQDAGQPVTIRHRPMFILPSRFSSRALIVLTGAFCLLLAGYFVYIRSLVRELERDEDALSKAYAQFMVNAMNPQTGLEDPERIRMFIQSGTDTEVLRELVSQVNNPVVVTDSVGMPIMWSSVGVPENIPIYDPETLERLRQIIRRMDRKKRPIPIYDSSLEEQYVIHYGDPPALVKLRTIPIYLGGILSLFVVIAVWLIRRQARTERGLIWAGMARESAHQLGTPLTSLHGWLELLKINLEKIGATKAQSAATVSAAGDPDNVEIIHGMGQDIERLSKVANRFELIGRRSTYLELDLSKVLRDTQQYFLARLPKRGTRIELRMEVGELPPVRGNATLLEWAFENLIKNSIDALTGRGGVIEINAFHDRERDEVDITFSDNGPGISRDVRRHIFETGVTTKAKGWGVGLSLTRRIIEENHGGRIILTQSSPEKGTVFLVCLPATPR